MLISYSRSKEPVIMHDDKIFVQSWMKEHIKFHPSALIFLTLSSPVLGNLTDRELFVYHHQMTQDFHVYQKLKAEKEKILPLLRMALMDTSLPDMSYFPFGEYDKKAGLSHQIITPYAGRVEFVQWIAWLQDRKSIPILREILLHSENVNRMNESMTISYDTHLLRGECIKALVVLGAKGALFEYLLADRQPDNDLIKKTLVGLMSCGLQNSDLPQLIKLCERYESLDQEAYELSDYLLYKLFRNPRSGSIIYFTQKGVLHDIDDDAPVQRLLCKVIARIGGIQSFRVLEDIYKHSSYRELCLSAFCAIRHRYFLEERKRQEKRSSVGVATLEEISRKYRKTDMDRFVRAQHSNKKRAWTSAATIERNREKAEDEKREHLQHKKQLAKNAAYFKKLVPGDYVCIHNPVTMGDDSVVGGKVLENDGKTLLIESWFMNKKRIGKRRFSIDTGQSTGPALFADLDDDGNKPYYHTLLAPSSKTSPPDTLVIPQGIHIPIIGGMNHEDEDVF